MTENFLNVVKDINLQIQEAQHTQDRINTKKIIPRNTIVSSLKSKDREKNLENSQKKTHTP